MPASGEDVPRELVGQFLKFAAQHCPSSCLAQLSLVCLYWAQHNRPALWNRTIYIFSEDKARWFKWLATTESSARLTPVLDYIRKVSVQHDFSAKRTWLHLLCYQSTWQKLHEITIVSKSLMVDGIQHRPFRLPQWGLCKTLPPRFTPYQKVVFWRLTFDSFSVVFRLLSQFTRATKLVFRDVKWVNDDTIIQTRRLPSFGQSSKKVRGRCIGSRPHDTRILTHLCLATCAWACPLTSMLASKAW